MFVFYCLTNNFYREKRCMKCKTRIDFFPWIFIHKKELEILILFGLFKSSDEEKFDIKVSFSTT